MQSIVDLLFTIFDVVMLVIEWVYGLTESPVGCGLLVIASAAIVASLLLHFDYRLTWLAVAAGLVGVLCLIKAVRLLGS